MLGNNQPANGSNSHISLNTIDQIYRRILNQSIAVICQNNGFESIQSSAMEMLTSLVHKHLNNLCHNSREYCEYTGRSVVTPNDMHMALVNMGIDTQHALPEYLLSIREVKPHLFTLKPQSPTKITPILQIAEPRPLPSYFPNFLPHFPDPHTYIKTEVKDDVDTNYEKVRRLNAQNKRDMERSLIQYALSFYPSVCVFQELAKRLHFEAKDMLEKTTQEQVDHEQQDLLAGEWQLQQENNLAIVSTAHSYVMKRVPAFCHILLPFDDPMPCVSALLTEENIDVEDEHDQNYIANILSKEMEEDLAENDEDETLMEIEVCAAAANASTHNDV